MKDQFYQDWVNETSDAIVEKLDCSDSQTAAILLVESAAQAERTMGIKRENVLVDLAADVFCELMVRADLLKNGSI